MSDTLVRRAVTPQALEAVERLRYDVYTAEMNLYHDTADSSAKRLSDPHDADGIQLLGTVGGVPVGTVRVHVGPFPEPWAQDLDLGVFAEHIPVERMAFGSRFTVLPEHRGSPIVLRLVEGCFEEALKADCELLILDCVPHLVNLYASLGWRRYTAKVLRDDATGVLIPMALVLRDRAHLVRVRSAFVALLDRLEPQASCPPWVDRCFDASAQSWTLSGATWSEVYGLLSEGDRPLFGGLSEAEVQPLLQNSQILELGPGHNFVRQGTVYRTLFLVLSGGVEVAEDGIVIRTLGRGEVLGEIAWLLGAERSADVRASSAGARVLALHEATFKSTLRRQPAIGATVMTNLARTLAARLVTASTFRHTEAL